VRISQTRKTAGETCWGTGGNSIRIPRANRTKRIAGKGLGKTGLFASCVTSCNKPGIRGEISGWTVQIRVA